MIGPSAIITAVSIFLVRLSHFVRGQGFINTIMSNMSPDPAAKCLRVVPYPQQVSTGKAIICLDSDFDIVFDEGSFKGSEVPPDLVRAAERTKDNVLATKHRWLSPKRGEELWTSSEDEEAGKGEGNKGCQSQLKTLTLVLQRGEGNEQAAKVQSIFDGTLAPVEQRMDLEAYTLDVPLDGPATITSNSSIGLFRGLVTFEQLFYYLPTKSLDLNGVQSGGAKRDTSQGVVYAPVGPYRISDRPSFPWRGVMLDSSRHFFSKASILRQLDTMALVKLNTFHWHITDSNSWPLDLSSHPELAGKGAYSDDEKYSEDDIKEIVTYAGERGIDVMMEIDMPSHTASVHDSHPEYVAGYGKEPWEDYAHQQPPGQIRFANKEVVNWMQGVVGSSLKLLKSPYFGTGCDELNERCMDEDEPTQNALKENNWTLNDALDNFTDKMHQVVRADGKTPMVWKEMVLSHGEQPSLRKDTIVHCWQSPKDAAKVIKQGFRVVHASSSYFYLDRGQGGWEGHEGGEDSDSYKSWQLMMSFDPYQNLTEDQRKFVLGGQVSVWSEQTDETNLEVVLWPRAAATAELFWSGGGDTGFPRSSIKALPRMHDIRYRMVSKGVNAIPLQPHWCAVRACGCVRNYPV